MGYTYDLFINRECEDCIYGEFDVFENKFWCLLHDRFRETDEKDPCPDIRTSEE
ncbi:MAG: hypothetical protein LBR73_01610 [Oscillospiraceae bacterium]|jgi:hypothetical protein|nr:hypothetical protein [Oscillospiraceae bacterium]